MMKLFHAYVMVDWSAAAKPATGADSIWVGIIRRNVRFQPVYEAHNPSTRAQAEALISATLSDLAKRDERTLVGFDFPLGLPRGTAAALKLSGEPWLAILDFLAAEVRDKPNNANNRFQVAAKMNRLMTGGAFPFWGAPQRDAQTTLMVKRPREHQEGDLPEFRLAEEKAKGASSVWKLYYQGSVGGQALTGAPMIRKLMKEHAGVRLWPFQTGWRPLAPRDMEGTTALFAEIYPSMFEARPAANEIKDAAQVRAAAEHFAALDEKGQLARLFGPLGDDPRRDTVEREEGWILGAPA